MEYYGNTTRGKDGRNYKSEFEADFCNKFLYQKYSYEYEKPYNDGSKRKSDFYLNDLDLYIECVYHNFKIVPKYLTYDSKVKIVLEKCLYDDRFEVKKFKAKWDANEKHWWTTNDGNERRLDALSKFMKEQDKEPFFMSDGKALKEDYDIDFFKKLQFDPSIIIVTYEDSQNCKDMNRIILQKANNICMRNLVSRYVTKMRRD